MVSWGSSGGGAMEQMYHAAVSESSVGSASSCSSSVKGEELDAKKRAKREANRRSAQLSRARKKAFIEDLKQKNHEYQRCEHILACHPDMCFAFDAAGSIEFANARACAQLDLSARELEAQSFFDMLVDESRLRFQSALQQIMSRPGQLQASLRFDSPLEMTTKVADEPLVLDVLAQCTRDENEAGQWLIVCAARPSRDSKRPESTEPPSAARNVFPGAAQTLSSKDLDDPPAKKPRLDDAKQPLNVFALVAAAADLEPLAPAPGPRVGALAAADAQSKKRSAARPDEPRRTPSSSLSSLSMAALSARMGAFD